jgi:hypothetical protein
MVQKRIRRDATDDARLRTNVNVTPRTDVTAVSHYRLAGRALAAACHSAV